ncbi:MAG: MarR family winged helix-turn-helix transcriptional regulator, partial [Burkholderiaceae bacterium]
EAAGRISRRPDPADGRRALATLTPAGRQLYRLLRGQAQAREAVVTATLSEAERKRLTAMLERMTEALLAADPPPPR